MLFYLKGWILNYRWSCQTVHFRVTFFRTIIIALLITKIFPFAGWPLRRSPIMWWTSSQRFGHVVYSCGSVLAWHRSPMKCWIRLNWLTTWMPVSWIGSKSRLIVPTSCMRSTRKAGIVSPVTDQHSKKYSMRFTSFIRTWIIMYKIQAIFFVCFFGVLFRIFCWFF